MFLFTSAFLGHQRQQPSCCLLASLSSEVSGDQTQRKRSKPPGARPHGGDVRAPQMLPSALWTGGHRPLVFPDHIVAVGSLVTDGTSPSHHQLRPTGGQGRLLSWCRGQPSPCSGEGPGCGDGARSGRWGQERSPLSRAVACRHCAHDNGSLRTERRAWCSGPSPQRCGDTGDRPSPTGRPGKPRHRPRGTGQGWTLALRGCVRLGGDPPLPPPPNRRTDPGTSPFSSGARGHPGAFVCAPFSRPLGGASEGRALGLTANGERDFLVSLNPPPTWVTVGARGARGGERL